MADKIEAHVQGTGTRVISLHGLPLAITNESVRRAVALDLAVLSFGTTTGPATKTIVERAHEFDSFLKG